MHRGQAGTGGPRPSREVRDGEQRLPAVLCAIVECFRKLRSRRPEVFDGDFCGLGEQESDPLGFGSDVAFSPARDVHLPTIEREEPTALTVDEVMRLADTIDFRYRALVLVGAFGGLRIGELAGLQLGHGLKRSPLKAAHDFRAIINQIEARLLSQDRGTDDHLQQLETSQVFDTFWIEAQPEHNTANIRFAQPIDRAPINRTTTVNEAVCAQSGWYMPANGLELVVR